jgi:hypothetical protein
MTGDAVVLDLPFRDLWVARNSPARRVPSHGTHIFGISYAIDFVGVDARGRSAPRTWRSLIAVEHPASFVGFGRPILAPADGIVERVHDGEPDHAARRSLPALVPYAAGQPRRVRRGINALAGNHVLIALGDGTAFVLLAHLRRGTVGVRAGAMVTAGDLLAECGNSGNSTEPHVHVQVTDSTDWARARGVPLVFRLAGGETRVPNEREIVNGGPPLPAGDMPGTGP